MLNRLSRLLDEANVSLADHQKNQPVACVGLLDKWNKAYNLTSVRDPNEALVCHILNNIVMVPYLQDSCFIDVGTGPGLFGIPLAIVRSEPYSTLPDSLGKRARFLCQVRHGLKLDNIIPAQSRVEVFPARPPFDDVISHAFVSPDDIVSRYRRLSAVNGHSHVLKGLARKDEIENLSRGYSIAEMIEPHILQLEGERHLVAIQPKLR